MIGDKNYGCHFGAYTSCISPQVVKHLENARQQSTVKLSYNPLCSYNSKTLKVIYNNTRSYKRHYDDIKGNYDIIAADIVFLAETQLTSHNSTEKYSITNFNAYWLDQHGSSKPYHGLIVYVHKDSQVMDITLISRCSHRRICVTIKKFFTVFTIIGVYISPQTKPDQLCALLSKCLSHCNSGPVIILGDFNIDISAKSNTPITKYMKTKYNFDQYVNEYTTNYQTTIDLLFSNHPHQTMYSIYCYWSDHNIIYTVINDQ